MEDETGKPIYKIVEEFADDHDDWAEAFLEAFPRMQSIGYTNLQDGPENSWLGYYSLEDMGAKIGSFYIFIVHMYHIFVILYIFSKFRLAMHL